SSFTSEATPDSSHASASSFSRVGVSPGLYPNSLPRCEPAIDISIRTFLFFMSFPFFVGFGSEGLPARPVLVRGGARGLCGVRPYFLGGRVLHHGNRVSAGVNQVAIEPLEGDIANLQVIGIALDQTHYSGSAGDFAHFEAAHVAEQTAVRICGR